MLRRRFLGTVLGLFLLALPMWAAEPAKVYVVLWFDTEDYILPASDDAALRVADFLTAENIRATFKVVGEKARTLERRGRTDVIAALKRHEIGFHANYHSTQPSPAMYLSNLNWDEGLAEFDRREGQGVEDIKRIFGVAPTCYGQPGSSWGPQTFGTMKKWGMQVYLDAGSHVQLDDKPHYYCGILTLYRLAHTLRVNITNANDQVPAQERFAAARQKLLAEGGGIVSIFYHPCEFVHKEFWDGVNFKHGANPPREQWKLPPAKTPEESRLAYQIFEEYIRFIKRFPDVQFITATEAAKLYRDEAQQRRFTSAELREIAAQVGDDATFQKRGAYALAASEVLALLNQHLVERAGGRGGSDIVLRETPYGPTSRVTLRTDAVRTDWSQFTRTANDVTDFLQKQHRVPSTVWLGSVPVAPESYLAAVARVLSEWKDGAEPPQTIELKPARFSPAKYVAEDDPRLWGWVIFPQGFRAPALMDLAKRQAWTLKPAVLSNGAN